MASSPALIPTSDLGNFFRTEVTTATSHLRVQISPDAEYYLVNLLCEYARRSSAPLPGQEPLALIYKRALEASVAQRIQILKQLGDLALYVSGFFVEFIERSMVDLDYYIAMGGGAYNSLSDLVGNNRQGEVFADVYAQLAEKFTSLVDVLTEVSVRTRMQAESDADLLRLYDRWLRTGSERLHRLLMERGLCPNPGLPTDYVQ